MRLFLMLALVAALPSSGSSTAPGWCRFSVRDVMFVDLDGANYQLTLMLGTAGDAGESRRAEWRDGGRVALPDAPVRLAVRAEEDAESRAVLRAADGRELVLETPSQAADVDAWFQRLLDSPLRRRLHASIVEAHSVAVFLPCGESAADDEARAALNKILAATTAGLPDLPKLIARGPELVEIAPAERSLERVALFGLGLDVERRDAPQVAVVSGRARRAGPVLVGAEISGSALSRILGVIGQSCECGLDRSWMQGPAVAMAWGPALQQRVVEVLGFDAENPLTKTEIARILAKSARADPLASLDPLGLEQDDLLFGYREESLDSSPRASGDEPARVAPESAGAQVESAAPEESGSTASWSWWLLGFFVANLSAAGWILWRGRR